MKRAAGQAPEPVMGRLEREREGIGVRGQAADPGSPAGPKYAPHFRGVRSVYLHGAVGGGRPLVAAYRSRLICRRAGIDQEREVVHMQQAAEGVGMRVARQ